LFNRTVEKTLEKWVLQFEFADMKLEEEYKEISPEIVDQVYLEPFYAYWVERRGTSGNTDQSYAICKRECG